MNSKGWVEGQRASSKKILFGAAFFVVFVIPCACLAYYGNGPGQWFGLGVAIIMLIPVLYFLLYRTWFFVDSDKKLLYRKKFLGFTWVKEFPYGGCRIDRGATAMMRGSPGGEYGSSSASSVYLVDKVADKKILLFSSDDRLDVSRVSTYLSKYIDKCVE